MQSIDLTLQSCYPQAQTDLSERDLRIQLAAAYRLIDRFGMSDLVDTHISVRLPSRDSGGDHFLINPYGLLFSEITAASLVKVDLQGYRVEPSDWPVNPAGFVIHSAIYAARPDINCVLHTHPRYGMAVSVLECGLLPVSQMAMQFYDRVAYHDYEGVSLDLDEQTRLAEHLGDKKVMIMRNHGLLTLGRTIPEAFILSYYLEKACETQILAQSAGVPLVLPAPEVCQKSANQQDIDMDNLGQLQWPALLRLLDRQDGSYRDG